MQTTILTDNLTSIINGLVKASDVITSTMGGQGKTVIISDNSSDKLRFTKDGVSVAKALSFTNNEENVGAKILISAANETVNQVGDGTTLTSLMLKEMILKSLEVLVKEQISVNDLLNEIEKAIQKTLNTVKVKKIKNVNDLKYIASIAANSNDIGELFKEIYTKTGFDSNIILEKGNDETYYEISKGLSFDSGFIHPSFMTDKDTEQAIYENAYIYIDENAINALTPEYEKMLGMAIQSETPLIIIAPKFSDAFMRVCSMNKVNKGAQICLIKMPGYGYGVKKNIDDIRSFLNEEGFVDKIIADTYSFTLFNEDTPYLEGRIKQLEKLLASAVEFYDVEDYEKRINTLKQVNVSLFAGGKTPEEMNEEYDRLEDAIGAVKAAIKKGYVLGGGKALYNVNFPIENLGDQVVMHCIKQPMLKILSNANITTLPEFKNDNEVYDVKQHKIVTKGVYDPYLVLEKALINAFTNTKLIINTSYLIYNEYQSKSII